MMRGKGIGGILVGLWVFWGTSVWAQAPGRGVIESPSAFVSGIGFISGWKCNSQDITLKVLCSPYLHDLDPAQNMPRADTREVCDGAIDNGWIIQVNWEHWAGCTEVTALDNGQQFASRKFTVGEIGEGFIQDQEGTQIKVLGFPSPDQVTHFAWSTATQHFEGMYTTDCGPDDACPGSGEGDDGNNNNPPVPYPAMIAVDGAYAGDQELVQYKGMLALPPPTYEELMVGATTGQRSNTVTWHNSFSFSMIFERNAWVATHEVGDAERLIPKGDLPERLGAVGKICTNTPLLHETGHVWVFNLTGVGGGITIYDGEDDDFYAETRVNRPDLAFEGGEEILYFINKDTAAIGFKIVPHNLNQAGGGWLDAMFPNAKCDGRDWGEENRIQCREKIKAIDAWVAEVWFPSQGRGPWRQVSSYHVALRPGHIFRNVQSCVRVAGLNTSTAIPWPHSSFITDLTGTGKLEIVLASKPQYNAWRERDDLSIFLAPELELGSVVD